MRTLTLKELEAMITGDQPEGTLMLRISPLILWEFLHGYWVRPDGRRVIMERAYIVDNEITPVMRTIDVDC